MEVPQSEQDLPEEELISDQFAEFMPKTGDAHVADEPNVNIFYDNK